MFAIVIDKEGFKVEFVILNHNKEPQNYKLKGGEKTIEEGWDIANAMFKPKWDGTKWIEVGTPEPIPPPEQIIDPKDILIAELSISLAETQSQGAQAIAELTEAISMLQIPTV